MSFGFEGMDLEKNVNPEKKEIHLNIVLKNIGSIR